MGNSDSARNDDSHASGPSDTAHSDNTPPAGPSDSAHSDNTPPAGHSDSSHNDSKPPNDPSRPRRKEGMPLNVHGVEWLKPNWVMGLRGGNIQVSLYDGKQPPPTKAVRLVGIIDAMHKEKECTAVFISKEDCALVQEYFPEALKPKMRKPRK